jgi:hypothetical protein
MQHIKNIPKQQYVAEVYVHCCAVGMHDQRNWAFVTTTFLENGPNLNSLFLLDVSVLNE